MSRAPEVETARPSPPASRPRRWGWLAFVLVGGFGLALLWPVPAGQMPMSADHTVHLTRIWSTADQLAHGRLAGWSSTWFFGFPVGELYPQLGDLIVIAVHTLGLGLLDWWQSYALGFSFVFVLQGWALLRAGRAFGLGLAPGLIAALLVLADPGMYREGGWMYTVGYGVWPQALATALGWWGFAELALAWRENAARPDPRGLALAALVLGAALLAHPMTIPMVAMGAPLFVLAMGLRGGNLRAQLAATALTVALALALAAWWVVPMLVHRDWMANYGWLFISLQEMSDRALRGAWTGRMPPAVGYVAAIGLVWAALVGRGFARFVAALALCSWMLASRDVGWLLRLDRLSDGFSHIQYQRFLMTAKPGLYLIAGAVVGALVRRVHALAAGDETDDLSPRVRAGLALAGAMAVIGAIAWLTVDSRRAMIEHEVGNVQLERRPGRPQLTADYQAFVGWAREQREQNDGFYRIAVDAGRNDHWFMDAPLLTNTATYKGGFTPGDNFVHKPESLEPAVLERLRVRYVVRPVRAGGPGRAEVATFGNIAVDERPVHFDVATLDGGELEILEDSPDRGRVRVRIAKADEGARLVFNVAGFPRWQLSRDGEPVEWVEVPVFGKGPHATEQARRAGQFRRGKADGDDGSEPTLIAALDAREGEYVLEYRYRAWFDWLADLCSFGALLLGGSVLLPARAGARTAPAAAAARRRLERLLAWGVRACHPLVVAGLAVILGLVLATRWLAAEAEQARFATGWLLDGRAEEVTGVRAAPFKADMLIVSAVSVRPRRNGPATVVFPAVTLGPRLRGWLALDDDATKEPARGGHRMVIEARHAADGEWRVLFQQRVRHRAGRVPLEVPTTGLEGQAVDLRVRVESRGEAPPPLAFDLELEPTPGSP